jgi:hypothetical protein
MSPDATETGTNIIPMSLTTPMPQIAYYAIVLGYPIPEIKQMKHEADHSPSSNA